LIFLIISSYIFYMSWNPRFAFLILFTSFSDFYLARKIYSSVGKRASFFLGMSILIDLGILSYFKYCNFFLSSLKSLLYSLGLSAEIPLLEITLPAGISFYTFQSLSYTIDVYRGLIRPEKNILRYVLFLSFFPQLVAGPIVTAKEFLPQIKKLGFQKFRSIPLKEAIFYIFSGFIKKSIIADQISFIPELVYKQPGVFGFKSLLICLLAYSIQIYGDFSGYTDIARGLALLLGFKLPENFNMPYFSSSFREFWNRWHISLSSWLKTYLYVSLGGNRVGALFTYRNLFITMLLGGIWHGANWTFVVWGAFHGLFLAIERFIIFNTEKRKNVEMVEIRELSLWQEVKRNITLKIISVLKVLFTFFLVSVLWVFFRAENFTIAAEFLGGIFSFRRGLELSYSMEKKFYLIFSFVFISHIIGTFYKEVLERILIEPLKFRHLFFLAILTIVVVLLSDRAKPFIYFVF
ncbi:MAG: MBOAT family protein, partial [Leptospiraceae bacterium]|nr:MBOAT family protein [Leptospiraceae bacterium]